VSLAGLLADFARFATHAHTYGQTLPPGSTGRRLNRAVHTLRDLCYPDLPFRKRVVERIETSGTEFYARGDKTKKEYRTVAGHFDAFLARNGHVAAAIPDDAEGLRAFLALMHAACTQGEGGKNLRGCLTLWRKEAHRLYLDELFDAAIAAHLGANGTKEMWKKYARRLADYAWHRQMPEAEYTRWLCKADLQGAEFKAAGKWIGIGESELRPLIQQFRSHCPASGAGAA
jgi:hypothetical protein